jgi:Protein of unknown function (DUF1598)
MQSPSCAAIGVVLLPPAASKRLLLTLLAVLWSAIPGWGRDERDAERLGRAMELSQAHDWRGAADEAIGIADDRARTITLAAIRQRTLGQTASPGLDGVPVASFGSPGGGAQADFTTLIDLIEQTVAPDSWEENGLGAGKIEPFPSGVYVDPSGLLTARMLNRERNFDLNRAPRQQSVTSTPVAASDRRAEMQGKAQRRWRAVSVNRLERVVAYHWATRQPIPDALLTLAGLTRIDAVACFPETGDIVLIGAIADRRADDNAPPFGCSIVPLPERLARTQTFLESSSQRPLAAGERQAWLQRLRESLGEQRIEIFGIEPTSRVARVLVEADHHMKQVALGLHAGPEPRFGYLDNIGADEAQQLQVLRWWFQLGFDQVLMSDERLAFGWRGTGVAVRSENEFLNERGERQHTGESSPETARFARRFTEEFPQLARLYPVYADLRNQFCLALACTCLVQGGLAERVDWTAPLFGSKGYYVPRKYAVPQRVESIVHCRMVSRGVIVAGVSGGVRAEPDKQLTDKQSDEPTAKLLERWETVVAAGKPTDLDWRTWWWDFDSSP